MEFEFGNPDLERLFYKGKCKRKLPQEIVPKFFQRMQAIESATDERDLYELKSLRFEKLKGDREHQRSIRLNKQWRLIVEIESVGHANKIIIRDIEDYH